MMKYFYYKSKLFITCLALSLLILSSCSMQKMRYSNGYRVEFFSSNKAEPNSGGGKLRAMTKRSEILPTDTITAAINLMQNSDLDPICFKIENTSSDIAVVKAGVRSKTDSYHSTIVAPNHQSNEFQIASKASVLTHKKQHGYGTPIFTIGSFLLHIAGFAALFYGFLLYGAIALSVAAILAIIGSDNYYKGSVFAIALLYLDFEILRLLIYVFFEAISG